jgi:Na+/H+ antiporter NhaC
MASIVKSIVSRAKTAVGGQVAVWLMGLMIFFDDYSNTLVVGNTARSLTDHLKVSREKLAYIVDSTAAPVACIALITTWIGYQIGLVDQALGSIPDLQHVQAYSVFIHSIPYSFYPILAIVFVLMIASSGLDFGPMYKAEKRARNGSVKPETGEALPAIHGDELEPKEPLRAVNAFVPIITLVVALMVSLFVLGEGDTLVSILETTSPYQAMMYSSFVGVLVAAQRILSVHETVDAWYGGLRATLFGMIILVLAWSLSDLTATLNTASYLVTLLADSLPVALIPAIVFILAAITAFTTGTSWGTMAIIHRSLAASPGRFGAITVRLFLIPRCCRLWRAVATTSNMYARSCPMHYWSGSLRWLWVRSQAASVCRRGSRSCLVSACSGAF